jgi:hypothetical protein
MLDMDEGVMGFVVEGKYLGPAFKGLRGKKVSTLENFFITSSRPMQNKFVAIENFSLFARKALVDQSGATYGVQYKLECLSQVDIFSLVLC